MACVLGTYELHLVKDSRYLSNADINKMKKDEIVTKLKELELNPRGNKEQTSKRLKNYYKRRRALDKQAAELSANRVRDRFYDYLCVVDFEATCYGRDNFEYPHEIIEFPVVLLRTTTGDVVDEFHSFCKPLINPTLSQFCMELTGITQDHVDNAPPFPQVLEDFRAFLEKHELGTKNRFAFVTDGPYDFGQFLQLQCQHCSIPIPHWMRYWINIRRSYCRVFKLQKTSLRQMLKDLDMEFSGRQHSGLDDARNIARIAARLLEDGVEFRINERLLRRDRLEAAGKASSPMRNTDDRKMAEESVDEDEEEENKVFALYENDVRKNSMQRPTATGPHRVRIMNYKVLTVSKNDFLHDLYEQCLTCDEGEDATENVEGEIGADIQN